MVDRWTNPTTASLRGEDSRPLQQTFSSLSSYLEKLDNAITAAAASGVSSLTAGTGIGLSGGTGAVTVSNTGVTSLAAGAGIGISSGTGGVTVSNVGVTNLSGTTNQIVVSASTGSITISLPSTIQLVDRVSIGSDGGKYWGGMPKGSLELGNTGANFYYSGGWSGSMGAGILANCADRFEWVIHDSGTRLASPMYYEGETNKIYIGRDLGWGATPTVIQSNLTVGSHTLSSNYWRFSVTPTNYTSLVVELGEYYGRAAVRTPTGTLQLVSTGDIWFSIDNNNRMGYLNTAGFYLEQGWFRPHGSSGIYFQSYGGGFHMSDSTWIRTYGGKNLYCDAEIRSNYPFSSNNTNNGGNLRMISGNLTYFGWFGYYAQYVDSTHVKTFVIDHPTKPDNYLVHACAEGPTSDVFYRGEGQLQNGICVVTLPDYFEELTELEGRTIMVTPISDENGPSANLAAYEIQDGEFVVEQVGGFHVPYQRFWWRVDAVRKGTAFDVEPLKSETEVSGDGPYTYARKRAA